MANTQHDTTYYDRCCYQRAIFDGNVLYDAFLKAKEGSDWKSHTQKFEMNYLLEISKIQKEIIEGKFEYLPSTTFILTERGKERVVHGDQIRDRIVKHALCDEILNPSIQKYLIYDNSASIQGKGIDFARRRIATHLRKYYSNHGSNNGYILLIDYSKYYDNIQHEILINQIGKYVKDEISMLLLRKAVDCSKVDVSYMTDEEYSTCISTIFNSNEYARLDSNLMIGEKYMTKHLNIGDQVAQTAGILYPTPIDNYIKIVRGVKYYARYMDDSYIIHESEEFLIDMLKSIIKIATEIGITINQKKTRICKLSDYWRFLQIQYSLTETGRIIQKINPKRITRMRRKMKKLSKQMSINDYQNWFKSWLMSCKRYMSKKQLEGITKLFNEEIVKCIR